MTDQEFADLKRHVEKSLHINDSNAIQLCQQIPLMYQQYLDLYLTELQTLKDIKAQKDILYGQLWHKYRRESEYEIDSKHEIEAYIKREQSYYELSIKINKQEIISQFLELTVNNIKQLSFTIKTYLDFKKYLNGF